MTWIKEAEAADALQVKPRTLRIKAKKVEWPITYTKVCRKYQYSKQDLDKFLLANSNKVKP